MLRLRTCLAVAVLLLPVGAAMGANLIANSGFDTDAGGWSLFHIADTAMSATWSVTGGNPAGNVTLARTDLADVSTGHRYNYVVAVTPGVYYRVMGDWKGSLKGAGTGINFAEVFVGFGPTFIPQVAHYGALEVRKRWDTVEGGTTLDVDQATGVWGWESFDDETDWQQAPTSAAYMFVSFNVGGASGAGAANCAIDNIEVYGCSTLPVYDPDNNCKVNFFDMAIMANNWMNCFIDPASSCASQWQ